MTGNVSLVSLSSSDQIIELVIDGRRRRCGFVEKRRDSEPCGRTLRPWHACRVPDMIGWGVSHPLDKLPMKITRIRAYRVELPLREGSYKWSGGKSVSVFDSTIVAVETDEGLTGYGEVCPLGPFYLPAYAAGARAGSPSSGRTCSARTRGSSAS